MTRVVTSLPLKRSFGATVSYVKFEPLVEVLVRDDVDRAEERVHGAALGRDPDDGDGPVARLLPRLHVVFELFADRVDQFAEVNLGPGVFHLKEECEIP